jgi:hypothetical protein
MSKSTASALPPIATAKADMPQTVMSALPPKAELCGALGHVCFGPIADILGLAYLDMEAAARGRTILTSVNSSGCVSASIRNAANLPCIMLPL